MLDRDDISYLDGKFGKLHERLDEHIAGPCQNAQVVVQQHEIKRHSGTRPANGRGRLGTAKLIGAGLAGVGLVILAVVEAIRYFAG